MSAGLPASTLGRTGLEVTRLGYGAWALEKVSGDVADTVLNSVLDAGINFIDTSIDYGRSEEFIGKYISHRRSEFYLATKCGCPVLSDAQGRHVFTHDNIVAGVNQSLARMKTDYLDFVQFHTSPTRETLEQDGAIDTLRGLQSEGKIRFLGSSATLPNITDHLDMGVFDEFQIPYSALERDHEDVITQAAEAGIGTVIRGGVAKGEPGVSAVSHPDYAKPWEKFDEAKLNELLEDGESRTAFILRFTLSHPQIHTTIVGTQNPEHLKENVAVAQLGGTLSADTYKEAKRRLALVGVTPAPARYTYIELSRGR
jgi:aryl-alcohol dehydrogenase-like predicted oxidoreductase